MHGLQRVVRCIRAGRDHVAVDADFGVFVEVVEQHVVARDRMRVRRGAAAVMAAVSAEEGRVRGAAVVLEHLQAGIAVAAPVRAEDLVVGAVLLDHVEHVLDLAARRVAAVGELRAMHGRVGRRLRSVLGNLRGRHHRREAAEALVGRRRQHADGAERLVRRVGARRADRGIVVDGWEAMRARVARIRLRAVAIARGLPDQRAAIRRERDIGRVVAGRQAADHVEGLGAAIATIAQRDRRDGGFAGIGRVQRVAVRRQRHRDRLGAIALRGLQAHEARDRVRGRVDDRHAVVVGHGNEEPIRLRVRQHVLRLRIVIAIGTAEAADRGGLRKRARVLQIDLAQRAVVGVGDIGIATAAFDADRERIGARVRGAGAAARGVDDRDLVRVVERDDQRLPVRRHRQAGRTVREAAGARRELVQPARAAGRGGQRQRRFLDRATAGDVDIEHVDDITGIAERRAARRAAALRRARDIGAAAVGREHHLPVAAGQRQHLHERAAGHVDDVHVVLRMAGRDAPVVAAIR